MYIFFYVLGITLFYGMLLFLITIKSLYVNIYYFKYVQEHLKCNKVNEN